MNHPEPSAPLLSVRNVSKRYGDRVALQDASFDLWPGEVLAVVGESGSGKSVSARAAIGLLPDTARVSGVVELGGRDVAFVQPGSQRAGAAVEFNDRYGGEHTRTFEALDADLDILDADRPDRQVLRTHVQHLWPSRAPALRRNATCIREFVAGRNMRGQ